MSDSTVARRAIGLVDLTDLGDHCVAADIDALCARAVGPFGSTAAVCVWPRFVAQAAQRLQGSYVRVATVVHFPNGGDDVAEVVEETRAAIRAGADEIDLVLPYRSFLAGRADVAAAMLDAVRGVCAAPIRLKVILESGGYPDLDSIRDAARLAVARGADFVKTSTGKTAVSATIAAVVMMLDAIRETVRATGLDTGRVIGLKPSGGIRTVGDAARYLAVADEMMGPAWVSPGTFRFGASGLLDALEAAIAADPAATN